MVEVVFQTDCQANVRELWTVAVPADIAQGDANQLRDFLMAEMEEGRACFESEEVSDEHDREFVRVLR